MALDGRVPVAVVGFDADDMQALAVLAESYCQDARRTGWPIKFDWLLRGNLGEWAVIRYLWAQGLAGAGPLPYLGPTSYRPASRPGGAREPVDIVIWRREDGKEVGLGIRTVIHEDLRRFGNVHYPARRSPDSPRWPDLLLACSIRIEDHLWLWHCGPCVEGMLVATARVAIWGALTKGEYQALYPKLPVKRGTPAFKPIPLAAFRPDTLRQVVEGAQRARG